MGKITNIMARNHVQQRAPFIGNNLHAEWMGMDTDYPRYCVFSYGRDWPLFVWENGTWYENVDRCSVTTSKHKNQTHPMEETMLMTVENMRVLTHKGIVGVAINPN